MRKLWALVMAAVPISFGSIGSAADHRAKSGNQEEALVVKNWKGEEIGSVRHVLLDSSTGNVAFIILSLDKEKKEIVIPLKSFSSYGQENGTLILNVSKGTLIIAPEFHLSDLRDPTFADRVYRFFDEAPPWTDRGNRRGKEDVNGGWPFLCMTETLYIRTSARGRQLPKFYLPLTRSVTSFIFI